MINKKSVRNERQKRERKRERERGREREKKGLGQRLKKTPRAVSQSCLKKLPMASAGSLLQSSIE